MVRGEPYRPTWLCPEPGDRDRVLDMEQRLRPVRALTFGVLALALVASGPWVGWWTLAPLVASIVGFAVVDRLLPEAKRPEYLVALASIMTEVVIAASVALTGGPKSPALAWLVLPTVTLPARFRLRGVVAGAAITGVAVLAVTLGVDPSSVGNGPQTVLFTLALVVSVVALSIALMRSDLAHRSEAIIDPLTGMLNRNALQTRVAELAEQARVSRQPVAIIVADLDRFKSINDGHGHAVGDAVLQEVAYRIRASLRAYDLAYRLGGEEFLVVLPGANAAQAAQIAEQLRLAVSDQPAAGLLVTMSLGVSASSAGAFDYPAVFADADQALYAAKHAGRNRVHTTGPLQPVPSAADAA